MIIATSSLTINAAFLREIKEDNLRLRELLEEVESLLPRAAAEEINPRQVVDALSALRDQLALHFSLEEAYGYFEDAVQTAPRLSGQAEELLAQHAPLFLGVCRMVEEAEQWLYGETTRATLPRLAQRFGKFLQDFRRHEMREADLIQEAFERDVGVGD